MYSSLLVAILTVVSIPSICAQQQAVISGRITDPSGAVVVKATVKLVDHSGRFESSVSTDTNGLSRF